MEKILEAKILRFWKWRNWYLTWNHMILVLNMESYVILVFKMELFVFNLMYFSLSLKQFLKLFYFHKWTNFKPE